SIKLTKNNWLRIFGNFLLIYILTGIIFWIIGIVFSLFSGQINSLGADDLNQLKTLNPVIIKSFANSFFNLSTGNILKSVLDGLQVFIIIVFIFLLFKRLEKEDGSQIWIDNGSQDILKQGYTTLSVEDL
ncbi:MAG: hypothetical protein PHZ26_05075, partial [Candidatus Gracilibacteria bacterium]|nr:hypothetical protein [Candidatus Gracilibacteria bacterium]